MKRNLLETAHDIANDLYEAGVIDAVTMKNYKALCIAPVRSVRELKPKEIKKIRLHEKISQSVFAMYLNTSVSTIRQWEQGEKHPRGTSLKLLNLVAEKGLSAIA
jgi:putative transcriptional regulator